MSPRKFTRFLVDVEAGRNLKLLRLTTTERWAYLHGVVALAAKSPDRGALLVMDGEPVTERDVAVQATVPVSVARATLSKARRLGMIYTEDGVERVHDFEEINPPPRRDETNAERQARHRERRRNAARNGRRNGGSNAEVTPPEVEVEVEETPTESTAGSTSRDLVWEGWLTATGRSRSVLDAKRKRIIDAALKSHGLDDCLAAVRNIGADPWAGGANDRGKPFNGIEHALGSAERIERWRDAVPKPLRGVPGGKYDAAAAAKTAKREEAA